MAFKVKKNLTPPLIKFVEGQPRYVKITSPMFVGKDMKAKEGDKKKEPALLCDVINLETGEVAQIIVSAVVKSVFTESYPNHEYVGKGFEITKQGRAPGKQYSPFTVQELELEEESPARPVAVESAKKRA